ncbi:hypothetical protein SEPCBS119000_005041 [Sporothrix epigloea]|uniref:Uncharacterized protein n=1 Tax=Sporothrix epigloea TaxID=1892477 RepID=A0ABP0DZ77_9PEZI
MDRAANESAGARQSKRLQLAPPSSDSDSEAGRSDSEHNTAQTHSTPPTRQVRPASQHQSPQLSHTPPKTPKSSDPQQEQQQGSQLHKTTSATHSRSKPQKHVVGGGGSTARLHARVPSSKALHKTVHHHHHGHGHGHHSSNHLHHVSSTSSTKVSQQQPFHLRQSSASPPLSAAEYAARFPFAAVPPPSERQQQQQQQPQRPQPQRRWTSIADGKVRNTNSSTASALVRRNVSASNLKRNQSHADVGKRTTSGGTRSTTSNAHLKRTSSNPAVNSDRPRPLSSAGEKNTRGAGAGAGRVHFEIGSSDEQEDEWVDAGSSNISGSRKDSLQHSEGEASNKNSQEATESGDTEDSEESVSESGSDSESEEEEGNPDTDNKEGTHDRFEDAKLKQVKLPIRPAIVSQQSPQTQQPSLKPLPSKRPEVDAEQPPPSSSASTAASNHRRSASAVRLLLPHTSPRGAPPMMSAETVSAMHITQTSPDSSSPRQLPDHHRQNQPGGSDDRAAMTSRFIPNSSHDPASSTTGGASFITASSSQPSTDRRPDTDRDPANASSSAFTTSDLLASPTHPRRARSIGAETFQPNMADDDGGLSTMTRDGDRRMSAVSAGGAGGTNPRRTRAAPPAELSRTQQKLNLERASSNIDRGGRQHTVPATGSLVGAGEFGMHDPRIGKLMEKTGMEYYMIRRYQNPVMRSLNRLSVRLGDRNWRIPSTPTNGAGIRSSAELPRSSRPTGHGHAATRSLGGGASGTSPKFYERDVRRGVLQSAAAAAATNLGANNNTLTSTAPRPGKPYNLNGSGGGAGEPSARNPFQQQQRLSGASLVDDFDVDSTSTILRNLWDKSLSPAASQD